ncbi:DUF6328 family protein [Streptomyces sp. TRM70308]|uniref:DUF6328 family protein n=1 Tax=Streptomyces sp. TRM70308 TaxID=3131932 RepID=UPI003D05C616
MSRTEQTTTAPPEGDVSARPAPPAPQHRPDEPPESPRAQINRKWAELLQETRVAQTGVQILLGFLLGIAFTARFATLGSVEHATYVVTVVLGALAAAALIAPVSIHRCLTGKRMKDEVVRIAGRLMTCGLVLLALTIGASLMLILDVVLPGLVAHLIVGGVMLWFAACWYLLPLWLQRRAARRTVGTATVPAAAHSEESRRHPAHPPATALP